MNPNQLSALEKIQSLVGNKKLEDILGGKAPPPVQPAKAEEPKISQAPVKAPKHQQDQGKRSGRPLPPPSEEEKVGKPDADPNKPPSEHDKKKKSRAVRYSAGERWIDKSLEDFPENDYRIFCGNLGNEVTDDVLTVAFRRYPSFIQARVVRDKKSAKTKGYGFVSLSDPQDFLKALKEMGGKYVGNRPITVKKSTWEDRGADQSKPRKKHKGD